MGVALHSEGYGMAENLREHLIFHSSFQRPGSNGVRHVDVEDICDPLGMILLLNLSIN